MRHFFVLLAVLVVGACAGSTGLGGSAGGNDQWARVQGVVDGDTLSLADGRRVRLVQIDTPEVGSGECYSRKAAAELRTLVPVGSVVRLEADWRLDSVDRYGRLLRYVFRRGINANLELVRRGAATVWFYHGDRGRYASQLLVAARQARAERRGLWGACNAVWDPYGPATTNSTSSRASGTRRCDPSYPDVCIPPPPPDLDCPQIPYRHFRVVGADPHHFDGDHDGIGCE